MRKRIVEDLLNRRGDVDFWLNIGIAGAVVAVVNLFLRHLRRERVSCDACRSSHAEVTKEFSRVVSNHMSHERESLDRLTEVVHGLKERVASQRRAGKAD